MIFDKSEQSITGWAFRAVGWWIDKFENFVRLLDLLDLLDRFGI